MKNTSLSTSVEAGSFESIASKLKSQTCLGALIKEPVPFPKHEGPWSGKYLPFRRGGEVVDGLDFVDPQYTFFHVPLTSSLSGLGFIVMVSDWGCEKNNGSCLELTLCSWFEKQKRPLIALSTISYVSQTEIGIDREIFLHPFSVCENFGTSVVKNEDPDRLCLVLDRVKGWITESISVLESD